MEAEYSISELAQATRQSQRTIHFYVKEKLIPPPSKAGGGAKYGEEHRLRLILIRHFQRTRLTLAKIRTELDAMSLEEMKEMEQDAQTSQELPVVDVREITWPPMEKPLPLSADMVGKVNFEGKKHPKDISFRLGQNKSRLPIYMGKSWPESADAANPEEVSCQEGQGQATDWRRTELIDGMEVHIRSDKALQYRDIMSGILKLVENAGEKEGGGDAGKRDTYSHQIRL